MKRICLLTFSICFFSLTVFAQKAESFDIISFKTPNGWQKESQANAVQFGAENSGGGIVLVTLFKSVPTGNDAKQNFESAWEAIVKKLVVVKGKRQANPTGEDNGWVIESGIAQYESEGKAGVVLLLTATGGGKMVNLLMLTNTDAFEADFKNFLESLQFPRVDSQTVSESNQPISTPTIATNSSFKFNVTNFDDGWTATEQADWVRVTKGNLAVLVHYPNQRTDAHNFDKIAGLQNAWNVLIAPRYSNIRNFVLDPTSGLEYIGFAHADAVDRSSGKNVHIVLVKKHYQTGNGRYLEFISNSKAEFDNEFGANRDRDYAIYGWDKIVGMQFYNKFPVGANDLVGKWSTSNYASLSYYYVNGGGFAGATATSTADEFVFYNSGSYQSDHSGASGMVGNQKFSRQVYKGKFTANDWTMTLTNRFQGGAEDYSYYFEAVKGGRILMLTNRNKTTFSLVKQ